MYCPKCGTQADGSAKFCRSCGHKLPKITHTTHDDHESKKSSSGDHLVQSEWTFLLYNLLTFGAYQIYWGWKQWEILKRVRKLNITPSARGIFIPLTSFYLFPEILKLAKETGYKGNYSPGLLATGFLIFNLINNKADTDDLSLAASFGVTAFIILLISAIAAPVIQAMNHFLTHSKEDVSVFEVKTNYGLIIVIVILFVLLSSSAFIS